MNPRVLGAIRNVLHRFNYFDLRLYSLRGHSQERKIDYQQRYLSFDIDPSDVVVDIGSGGEPFPHANYLVDLYPNKTQHRYNELQTNKKPFVRAAVDYLPFRYKSIDFVYCSHVLEHVPNPALACEELMRVGKRGYIEVPTRLSDIMFNFTKIPHFHKWYVCKAGRTLIFIEYSNYERRDIGTNLFYLFAHSQRDNPIRRMFRRNKDLITHMFLWDRRFAYYVFNKDGVLLSHSTDGIT